MEKSLATFAKYLLGSAFFVLVILIIVGWIKAGPLTIAELYGPRFATALIMFGFGALLKWPRRSLDDRKVPKAPLENRKSIDKDVHCVDFRSRNDVIYIKIRRQTAKNILVIAMASVSILLVISIGANFVQLFDESKIETFDVVDQTCLSKGIQKDDTPCTWFREDWTLKKGSDIVVKISLPQIRFTESPWFPDELHRQGRIRVFCNELEQSNDYIGKKNHKKDTEPPVVIDYAKTVVCSGSVGEVVAIQINVEPRGGTDMNFDGGEDLISVLEIVD